MTSTLDTPGQTTGTGFDLDPKRFRALAIIAVAQLMVVLDASVVIIALPSAQRALHISAANRQWMLTAYTLSFAGLLLLGGRIADYFGRKRMFVISLIGFAGASALGGLAQDSAMLFGARALQGAFAAVMAPAALSLLTVAFTEPKERARAFAVYGGIAGAGAAIGLILGGVLTEFASWRWTLLINVPIAIVAAVAAFRYVSESRASANHGYDLPGAATVTGGLLALVYGFTKAGTDGWGSSTTVALFAIAAVLLVAFVVIEQRAAHPLLPLRVVLDRNRGGSFLASLLVGTAMLGTFLSLTYYFQGTLHYSALKTGFAFVPFSLGIISGATAASRLLPRFGPRALLTGGLLLATAGLVLFSTLDVHSAYVSTVLPAELIVSLGMGLSFVAMSSTALLGVSPEDAGVASALVNSTQQTGSSMGAALDQHDRHQCRRVLRRLPRHLAGGTHRRGHPRLHDRFHLQRHRVGRGRRRRLHPDPASATLNRRSRGRGRAGPGAGRRLTPRTAPGPRRASAAERLGVVPVGQERAQRGQQDERLVEHGVVPRFGQLDHRRDPTQLLVHGGTDVRRHQPALGAQQRQPAVDLLEVGRGDGSDRVAELLEDPAVELPLPPTVHLGERVACHEVDHVVEVVLLRRHGAEAGEGVVDGRVRAGSAERIADVERANLGVGLLHR